MKKTILASLVAVLLGGGAFFAHAQFDATGASNLELLPFPANPEPFSQVRIELHNFATDLNKASITWTQDGKVVARGTGVTDYVFKTGKRGAVTTINVTVVTISDGTLRGTLSINPSDVDLVWEADTTVPLLYKGKALPSSESTVKVVAFPHLVRSGKEIPADKLTYTWKIDGKVQQKLSGFGKNILIYQKNLLRGDNAVSVEVSSLDNTTGSEKEIVVPEREPEIHFYENNALEGIIYDVALDGGFTLVDPEASLRAEPYYFSTADMNTANSSIEWSVNGEKVPASKVSPLDLVLRAPKDTEGESRISLTLTNNKKIIQSKEASTVVTFKKQ